MIKTQQENIMKDSSRKKLLETIIQHVQSFLKWLIDIGIKQESNKSSQQGQDGWNLLLQSYSNQRVWMEHLSLVVELFIKATDEMKEVQKPLQVNDGVLEKIPEA